MPKILLLYYSQTGNTEKMASAVAEGARSAPNIQVDMEYHVDADHLAGVDAVVLGVPTYHHDMPTDIKRLFEQAAEKGIPLKGKVGAAFGSYGWTGEAPNLVLEIMKNKFEMHVTEKPLMVKYGPDAASLNACRELGRRISESLIQHT
jgi:flavodoxin I